LIGIGSSVGHYVVRAKLGEGAMGTVYLAQHHVLDAQVAIKVIRHDAERTEEDVSRFFTEARSASRIGHENIVSVLDFGRTADGDPYYIMELLTGVSLAGRLADGRRGLDEVLHVGTQIADALAASHQKGIVHRDLKPGNVFLVRRGADARFVKLLDFGVAKLTEEGEEQRGHRTHTGRLLGTPHYMAPEQVAGRRTIDGRADVYALGVLLFEMICGRLPFLAPKWTEVLIQHVTQAPPRVSELVPGCPAWLDRLVDRALAKSAVERPSMAAMRDALRAQDDAALAPLPASPVLPLSAPPTARPDAPTLASETQLASADTVASDASAQADAEARARMLRTRNRARRSATLVALALGAGGTALGAVVVVSTRGGGGDDPTLAGVAVDAGPRPDAYSFKSRITDVRNDRWKLEDAGVGLPVDQAAVDIVDDSPAPPPTPFQRPAAPRPDAGVPLPPALDAYDIEHALADTRGGVSYCANEYSDLELLDVHMIVAGDGRVTGFRWTSDLVGTPFAMCVERAIGQLATFPRFAAESQEVHFQYGIGPMVAPATVTPGGSVGRRSLQNARTTTTPRR
jgi:tRNA A-37 threonylcarbamoyl transferase component Bud32